MNKKLIKKSPQKMSSKAVFARSITRDLWELCLETNDPPRGFGALYSCGF
jgi:hypothetical protein